MLLSSPRGDPGTTYINASEITFRTCKQTFIAAQAPKENTIENFWQMIIDKKVWLLCNEHCLSILLIEQY